MGAERELTLQRLDSGDQGTFGSIRFAGKSGVFCVTGELPDRGNKPFVSCIPPGRYELTRHRSPKFGDCCLIHPVPGRSSILIHRANFCGDEAKGFKSDLQGCIAVGETTGMLNPRGKDSQKCVLQSASAFKRLMLHLWADGDHPWAIVVRDPQEAL